MLSIADLVPVSGSPHRHGASRTAMTLVEMLVAMTITLIMMAAVAQIFGMMGQGVNGSRSMAELNDRMRATAYRLRQDLAGVTVAPDPPVRPELNTGYLEIIEGPDSDLVTYASGEAFQKYNGGVLSGKWQGNPEPYRTAIGSDDRIVGDIDDIILFTTRTTGESFSGKADARTVGIGGGMTSEGGGFRSPFAEVVWFCRLTANTSDPRMYTLHRRQRLIAAHPGAEPFVNTTKTGVASNVDGGPPNTLPFTDWATLHGRTDISCRQQGSLAIPNCLGDLTKRENRFLHGPTFPHVFDKTNADLTFGPTSPRFGEDVILTNVIAFDVRVWDPEATVQAQPTGGDANDIRVAVVPGDPAYVPNNPGEDIEGAYVDLGNGVDAGSTLAGRANARSQLDFGADGDKTYCTWSSHYDQLGISQAPPYATPLKGLEIRIRCFEPSTAQVRQITVRHTFEN